MICSIWLASARMAPILGRREPPVRCLRQSAREELAISSMMEFRFDHLRLQEPHAGLRCEQLHGLEQRHWSGARSSARSLPRERDPRSA